MKVETLNNEVKGNLAFIADHKGLLNIKATEIKQRLSKEVSSQHINIVLSGNYKGRYNNPFVLEILNRTIEIIKEKRAALLAA